MKTIAVTGVLYLLPYSGWAEVHADDGLSVFWFDSSALLAMAPYINERVIAYYDDSILAVRHINEQGKVQDAPQLVRVEPEDKKKRTLSKALKDNLKITSLQHHPLCWLTSCRQPCATGSAYCEEHTTQIIKESK